jgi:hypothetical protein
MNLRAVLHSRLVLGIAVSVVVPALSATSRPSWPGCSRGASRTPDPA